MKIINVNLKPDISQLRQFGGICFVAFGLLGWMVWWKGGLLGLDFGEARWPVVYLLWGAGSISGLFSLVFPRANRPLFVGLSLVTYPIGYVVSHVVMALIFFGVITPVGLLFRILGRDPLNRRFESDRESYWEPHQPPEDEGRYYKQF